MAISGKCSLMNAEHQRIKEMHRTLTSTGCSRDFCQAGRATHTDEQRVGENRALENVCEEAVNFLRDLYDEDFFPNEQALQERLQAVYTEILGGTVEGYARENKMRTQIGGNWTQTPQELEFGVQRAWRNARKCIARNHHQELKLCDLRSVTSSIGMAQELIRNTLDAFNDGKVEPTVFVFPPRTVDSRGPMIWNHQILEFAGYEMDDGIILGDPANVGLTKAILELGWTPPQPRGRWDLLPLVTMAEGDTPAMMEIPAPLSTLVHIRHPRYPCFEDLDLNWVAAPALTRLGFDIGGVQYTAAPFIGWFMDAEIAVRNLADSFRYNVLPNIVQAMNLTDGKLQDGIDSFDDLPEYEQLAMLSRAQTELNYAVKWSFNNSGVTMTDSLTASKKWCSFDDKFKKEHGYRLPADPYWIAPPQGSIIPVWHRGGAPNYQPKPMISKHVQDPINAWKREERRRQLSLNTTNPMTICQTVAFTRKEMVVNIEEAEILRSDDEDSVSLTSTLSELKTIAIYFCSAGTIAEKLAKRLHKRIDKLTKVSLNVALSPSVECLNDLQLADMIADKIFLLVVSSSGKGEVPANGSSFIQRTSPSTKIMAGTTFAVFGNGDSRYSATYNGAAETIYRHLQKLGGLALIRGVFRGDIAVEPIPYTAMNAWCNRIELRLNELGNKSLLTDGSLGDPDVGKEVGYELTTFVDDALDRVTEYAKEIHSFEEASIVATKPGQYDSSQRSLNLVLDIGNATYKEANCIQILPLNHPAKVDRVLKAMKLDRTVTLGIPILEPSVDITSFLSQFADLELPFKSSHWLFMNDKTSSSSNYLMGEILGHLSTLEALELLDRTGLLRHCTSNPTVLQEIFLSMPLLHPRTYSVASSPCAASLDTPPPQTNTLDIMLKRIPTGRFSSTFLHDHADASSSAAKTVKIRIVDSVAGPLLRQLSHQRDTPAIFIATGAGFAPVRCLLQDRIHHARHAARLQPVVQVHRNLALFLAFHPTDIPLATPILDEATGLGLVDTLHLVQSNQGKTRVQDLLIREDVAVELKRKLDIGAWVFVCANEAAAKGCKAAFELLLRDRDVEGGFWSERYVEEVY